MNTFEDFKDDLNRETRKTLILEVIPGTKPTDEKGRTDSRLFNVDTPLNAVMDGRTLMWSLKYDQGSVPAPLKGQFTSFRNALKQAEWYFQKRNVRVKEIKE